MAADEEGSKTVWDWSRAYKRWEAFDLGLEESEKEQPKDFEEMLKAEAEKSAGPDGMGHYHDHSEERKFFEKPEDEKMRYCEKHRVYGNVLYDEGMLPKAVEQYQLALSYYEYCFPETEEAQNNLDETRYACLCNASLCHYRLGEMRKAIDCASKVLIKNPRYVKALFRRAKAYRELDEYENASADINLAIECNPHNNSLKEELRRLIKQKESAKANEKDMAQRMMGAEMPSDDMNFKSTDARSSIPPEHLAEFGRSVLCDSTMPLEAYMPQEIQDILM